MARQLPDIHGKLKTVLWGETWFDVSLYLLFFSVFLAPFIDSAPLRLLIMSLIMSLMMIAGVLSVSGHALMRIVAGLTACIAIVLRWLQFFIPSPELVRVGMLSVLVFLIMLNVVTLTKVFAKGRVTTHRIKGAIACYILFGMTWAILYTFLDLILPNAFSLPPGDGLLTIERQEKLTFFSYVTLTTVGYGDILPTHDITRMFAVMQALVGQLYPATLLARLVSLELMTRDSG